jgi:hypothetical protein
MIRLSNSDGRFVAQLLELRRAALLEMRRPSGQSLAGELRRLDTVQIKAVLPQIADTEIAGAVKLVRNL